MTYAQNISLPKNLIRVPLVQQATDYTCGVAAVQSILMYWGDEYREDQLVPLLKCKAVHGTNYVNIANFAKQQGFNVQIKKNMTVAELSAQIDKRRPVICLIQAWPDKPVNFANDWDDGHYVVAVGYDDKNFYFMDPSTLGNYTYIPRKEFERRWHDVQKDIKLVHFGMTIWKDKPSYDSQQAVPLK